MFMYSITFLCIVLCILLFLYYCIIMRNTAFLRIVLHYYAQYYAYYNAYYAYYSYYSAYYEFMQLSCISLLHMIMPTTHIIMHMIMHIRQYNRHVIVMHMIMHIIGIPIGFLWGSGRVPVGFL